MLLLVVPTVAAIIHFVDAAAFMCPAAAGTVVAAEVVVPPDMHYSPSIGAATSVVVGVVAIVVASVAGAAIVAVSVAALVVDVVAVGVATLTSLTAAKPSTPLVCPAQNFPSPFVLFVIHPHHAPVPSGNVLCCTRMHAPSYMWASSRLTLGSWIGFWHKAGHLYSSWSTSYPNEKQ